MARLDKQLEADFQNEVRMMAQSTKSNPVNSCLDGPSLAYGHQVEGTFSFGCMGARYESPKRRVSKNNSQVIVDTCRSTLRFVQCGSRCNNWRILPVALENTVVTYPEFEPFNPHVPLQLDGMAWDPLSSGAPAAEIVVSVKGCDAPLRGLMIGEPSLSFSDRSRRSERRRVT